MPESSQGVLPLSAKESVCEFLMSKLVRKGENPLAGRILGAVWPIACFESVIKRQAGFGPFCTLSFDCDFPRDIRCLPQIVELFTRFGIRASFACVGRWVREYPDEHRLLVDAGFELLNHTETHPNLFHPDYDYARDEGFARERFNEITFERRREEIANAHQTFGDVLGVEPVGFRAPHFGILHVDDVYSVLAELGYLYSSSTMAWSSPNFGLPHKVAAGIWEFPLSPCPLHPFGVLDSWHSLGKHRGSHASVGELSGLVGQLCERVIGSGGYANMYFDPHDVMQSGELERSLGQVSSSGIRVVDYGELALMPAEQAVLAN